MGVDADQEPRESRSDSQKLPSDAPSPRSPFPLQGLWCPSEPRACFSVQLAAQRVPRRLQRTQGGWRFAFSGTG